MQISLLGLEASRFIWKALPKDKTVSPGHKDAIELTPSLILRLELIVARPYSASTLCLYYPRGAKLEPHRDLLLRLLEYILVRRPSWRRRLDMAEEPFAKPRFLMGDRALPSSTGEKLQAMSHFSLDYLGNYAACLPNLEARHVLDVAYQLAKMVSEPREVEAAPLDEKEEHMLARTDRFRNIRPVMNQKPIRRRRTLDLARVPPNLWPLTEPAMANPVSVRSQVYEALVDHVAPHEKPQPYMNKEEPGRLMDRNADDPAILRETRAHLTVHYVLVLLGFSSVSETAKADYLHPDRLKALTVGDFETAFETAAEVVDSWRPDYLPAL
jgi:hypothetical protein